MTITEVLKGFLNKRQAHTLEDIDWLFFEVQKFAKKNSTPKEYPYVLEQMACSFDEIVNDSEVV
jgi:hypothetical protein